MQKGSRRKRIDRNGKHIFGDGIDDIDLDLDVRKLKAAINFGVYGVVNF